MSNNIWICSIIIAGWQYNCICNTRFWVSCSKSKILLVCALFSSFLHLLHRLCFEPNCAYDNNCNKCCYIYFCRFFSNRIYNKLILFCLFLPVSAFNTVLISKIISSDFNLRQLSWRSRAVKAADELSSWARSREPTLAPRRAAVVWFTVPRAGDWGEHYVTADRSESLTAEWGSINCCWQ